MATTTRSVLALTTLFMTTFMVLSGATTATADQGNPPPGGTVNARGPVITVKVSDSRPTGGSPGPGDTPGIEVRQSDVPAPCWVATVATGKEAYQHPEDHYLLTAWPGLDYAQHKNDDKGHWFMPDCDPSNWPNQNDIAGYVAFAHHFNMNHPAVYVEAKDTPPPEVPPEVLRQVAINNLTLQAPTLDWNPKLTGRGTLVNLETWFWLVNPPPTTQTVSAEVPSSTAIVTVTFTGMDISAEGEDTQHCPDPGTPYTPGALKTTCALAFSRASSALGLPATPVTVAPGWKGTWTLNGHDQGALVPQPVAPSATVQIMVDEVQTLVTGAG